MFGLPAHVARFFRPTLLSGLGLSNTDLGRIFSVYGIVAMLSYLPGGVVADHFSARRLMTASLLLTGSMGIYLLSIPSYSSYLWIYGFFGVTTILLFWAALIRATREWGSSHEQGMSFGVLDGGRGLFAAGLASLALIPLQMALGNGANPTAAARTLALRNVYLVYTTTTFLAAGIVWLLIPDRKLGPHGGPRFQLAHLSQVLRTKTIWLQGALVFSAYCAFKGIDNYALFAVQAYGLNEVEGARVSVLASFLRPISALFAGLLADRLRPTRVTQLCFAALLLAHLCFALVTPQTTATSILWATIALSCAAAYGLRGVYLAIMEESGVPREMTGTAAGLICLVGFTPDAFLFALAGWLLDRSPGATGHRHFFACLAAASLLGLFSSWILGRKEHRP